MESVKWYKSTYLWNVVAISALMLVQLFVVSISMDGIMPSMWVGVLVGTAIGSKIKKRNDMGLIGFLLVAILVNHFFLLENGIYIPNYFLVFVGLSAMVIRDVYMKKECYAKRKIALILTLLVVFFSANQLMYGNNILKDQNFYREVKKEFNIDGRIDKDDLDGIDRFSLHNRVYIDSLEGIENFSDLAFLSVWDGSIIGDFTPLAKLDKLEKLVVWYMDVDKLEEIEEMEPLDQLEILYPKKGKIDSLENFPNLKCLYIQGMELRDLNGLKGSAKIEELHLGDASIKSFEGIINFPDLQILSLYEIANDEWTMIFNLENLKRIKIQGGAIEGLDELKRMADEKGIILEMRKNSLDKFVFE